MPRPVKPPPLEPGAVVRVIAPASPVEEARLRQGSDELSRLGYLPRWDPRVLARQGYFAGSTEERAAKLLMALEENSSSAVFCARGGYGSNYILELLETRRLKLPKILLGYSDITSLQLFLWRKRQWVTFYGPMVAAGLDTGPGVACGYDDDSLARALTETNRGWTLDLQGETLIAGNAEGVLLGGCMTLVEATLGTPWEIETRGSILLLEDRAMKPYQVDRALMHLKQAGKLQGVRAVILGEFPECEPSTADGTSVRTVCERLLEPLRIPVVWGAPIGHTWRPMLTVPLGVRARVVARGSGRLEILEPACSALRRRNIQAARKAKTS
jgi:muramoyltetrapeptide carboxypeptidase